MNLFSQGSGEWFLFSLGVTYRLDPIAFSIPPLSDGGDPPEVQTPDETQNARRNEDIRD